MKLKQLRERAGLSQYDIAPILQVTQATYANYELGKTQPTIETLIKIADYYGVSLDYLCDHTTKAFDFGYLNEQQIYLINKIKALDNTDLIQVNGYVDAILSNKNNSGKSEKELNKY